MNSYSVLGSVTRADIRRDPYPHIVIENCLPPALYSELAGTYPGDATLLRLAGAEKGGRVPQNSRHNPVAKAVLNAPGAVPRLWEEFVRHHVSRAFFQEFVDLFGADIRTTYPALETRLGQDLSNCSTAIRYDTGWQTAAVALDCQIGINTPATRRSSVRRVHTDQPDELFAMLLYFRPDADRASGGDLEICRWKKDRPHRFVGTEVDEADAERVAVVPYRANTLVAFLNSEISLHAVSARDPSPLSRRLVNIVGRVPHSVPEGLFVKRQKKGLVPLACRALQHWKYR